jgi:hypothetical protein
VKRRLVKLVVFLLLGAIVNVAVAWGCAFLPDATRTTDYQLYSLGDDFEWQVAIETGLGTQRVFSARMLVHGFLGISGHSDRFRFCRTGPTCRAGRQPISIGSMPLGGLLWRFAPAWNTLVTMTVTQRLLRLAGYRLQLARARQSTSS